MHETNPSLKRSNHTNKDEGDQSYQSSKQTNDESGTNTQNLAKSECQN